MDDDALEQRVSALERQHQALDELVEGHEPWSHRMRLHALEKDAWSAKLAQSALKAYRRERGAVRTQIREWGTFALAAAAIAITLWHG